MAGGKTARRDKSESRKVYGKKVMIVNMSGVDKFCPISKKKLPKNGMVVEYEGQYYAGWNESEKAATV